MHAEHKVLGSIPSMEERKEGKNLITYPLQKKKKKQNQEHKQTKKLLEILSLHSPFLITFLPCLTS